MRFEEYVLPLGFLGLGKVTFLDANNKWGPFWYKEIELLIAGLCYEREQATDYHQLPAESHWDNSDNWQIDLEIRTREEMRDEINKLLKIKKKDPKYISFIDSGFYWKSNTCTLYKNFQSTKGYNNGRQSTPAHTNTHTYISFFIIERRMPYTLL